MIDEKIFLESACAGIKVVRERGDPAVLGYGPDRPFVIVMGVADKYVVLEKSTWLSEDRSGSRI